MMARALGLARRGLGRVAPNPAVGCIIARGDRILGRGWTQPCGRPHAERMALDAAGAAARGATAYVTLEPCAHHGRTPPCADALIAAGIARVVAPFEDPDPRVSGRGFARLAAAGIRVETGLMAGEARELNRGFLDRFTRGRPLVTLKLALTIDGRIATRTGDSRWITGRAARRYAHLLRARHDAILVGAGTARIDDPMLDVRGLGLAEASPVRVVADARLTLPPTSRLAMTADRLALWIAHDPGADPARAAALSAAGARLLPCPTGAGGRLDLAALLELLAGEGITRLLCEGGGTLAAALLAARLVDRLVTATAGCAIGADGTPALAAMGVTALAEAPRLRLAESRWLGGDLMAAWEPADPVAQP